MTACKPGYVYLPVRRDKVQGLSPENSDDLSLVAFYHWSRSITERDQFFLPVPQHVLCHSAMSTVGNSSPMR